MKLLNIACGSRYHPAWINIDFFAHTNEVKKVNILKGLPFEDGTIDAIYSSHLFEHLTKKQANNLLIECNRVLKKNGIIRITVPDLENICREYLRVLDDNSNSISLKKYSWITVELLDQLVRTKSGGEMIKIYEEVSAEKDLELAKYINQRVGFELIIKENTKKKKSITFNKIGTILFYLYIKLVSKLIPGSLRDMVFINTTIGEKHQWMYDKFSISMALKDAGFNDFSMEQFNTSRISNFQNYLLDINADGTPYKGVSSLYAEAVK